MIRVEHKILVVLIPDEFAPNPTQYVIWHIIFPVVLLVKVPFAIEYVKDEAVDDVISEGNNTGVSVPLGIAWTTVFLLNV